MPTDRGTTQRHALGVDFGTSNTVAVARWPDGRARPILIDGSPLLPSAVYAEPDGHIVVGRDAVHSARLDPARFEPNPKRRIDDGEVLLADSEFPVANLITAVLSRVAEEWRRTVGDVPTDVTLTCPATWGSSRRTLLAEAAARAGFERARLVAEPVAAATYFAEVLGRDVPIGSVVVVHDFGAGTFDASVVARTAEGFEVLAVDGRDDVGGLDVDAAVVAHLATLFGADPKWPALTTPGTVEQRRAQRQLWDDVRVAKERLSRTQAADLVVPLVDAEVHLTREELEELARPLLDQTVEVTAGLLRWADLPAGRLAGVFLVGGASRIPLVATLLHRALGEAPVVIEQPELVVAEGSILAGAALLTTEPAAPGPTSELRLVAARRRESETVRVPQPPAVLDVDDAETVRTGAFPPAVDPWAHVPPEPWRPDPAQTVIGGSAWHVTDPPRPPLDRTRVEPERRVATIKSQPVRPQSGPPAPTPAKARPPKPAKVKAPKVAKPAPPPRPKRVRKRRFLRFVRAVLVLCLLVGAPAVALVLAYGYGNDVPIAEDARNLVDSIARHLRGVAGI